MTSITWRQPQRRELGFTCLCRICRDRGRLVGTRTLYHLSAPTTTTSTLTTPTVTSPSQPSPHSDHPKNQGKRVNVYQGPLPKEYEIVLVKGRMVMAGEDIVSTFLTRFTQYTQVLSLKASLSIINFLHCALFVLCIGGSSKRGSRPCQA